MCVRRIAFLGLVAIGSVFPALAFAQFQPPNQEELKMTSDPKAPGTSAVYLYREETTDDPHHFATVYARIKILSEKGKEAATVHVTYARNYVFHTMSDNSSRMGADANHWDAPDITHTGEDAPNSPDTFNVRTDIAALEGRTIHPDGTVIPLTGSASDLLKIRKGANQLNEYTFTLPSVEVGSVIEYRYQIRYDRYAGAPTWQVQKNYFTHKAHFAFTPDERFSPFRNKGGAAGVGNTTLIDEHGESATDIRSAAILPPTAAVKAEASGDYTLDITDVPALPVEPYGPPVEGRAYEVAFYYLPTPDEKEYWQKEMGYWNKKLIQYIAPTDDLKNVVRAAIAPTDTPLDKAKKLYAMTEKIENIDFSADGEPGVGSDWIPAGHVDKVLQEKKGTSNQIAYLYLALARVAGLDARPERIGSRSQRIFSPQFRNTRQLDSIVIAVEIDGKEITLDPGTSMAPFQTLHWAHAAAAGVALGANGKVETILTPAQTALENAALHVGNLNISANGTVTGTVKIAFLGQQAIYYRQMALRAGQDAVKAAIGKLVAGEVPQGIMANVDHLVNVNEPTKQFLAIIPITGTLGTQPGGRLVIPRNFFEARSTNPFPANDERILPVAMRYPLQEQEHITYVLPAGYTVVGKPEDTTLKFAENAAYQSKAKVEATSFTNARVLARGFTLLDPKDYIALHDFYSKVIAADQQEIVLSPAASASAQ